MNEERKTVPRNRPKIFRKFGPIKVIDVDGKEKIIRSEEHLRVHPTTGHLILDDNCLPQRRKEKDANKSKQF